nr:TetR/AcrR family transcriptional regulator [Janibacter cremeus]
MAAARAAFAKQGFGATNVSDITDEAGVSRATFYVYFASKQDVFAALAKQVRDTFLAAQSIDGLEHDDVVAVLRVTSEASLRAVVHNLELMRILDHQALSDNEIRILWAGIRRRSVRRTAKYYDRLKASGIVQPAADTEAVAQMAAGMNEMYAPAIRDGSTSVSYALTQILALTGSALGLGIIVERDATKEAENKHGTTFDQ